MQATHPTIFSSLIWLYQYLAKVHIIKLLIMNPLPPPVSCSPSGPTILLSPCSQALPWMVCILLCNLITGEILHKIQLCYCMTPHNCIMPHSNKAVSSKKFTQLRSSLDVRDQVSHPHKTESKIIAITQKTGRQKILKWIKSWTKHDTAEMVP